MNGDLIKQALADPSAALVQLDRLDCKESLIEFVRQGWHAIEPGVDFVDGWAIQCMARHLEAVTRGDIKRLLINVPPGFSKSMLVNVFWPAWEWGPQGKPHYRYISASYAQTLATRDMVRCRDLVLSEWYQERWPLQFKKDQGQKTYYQNDSTGFRFSVGVGGGLTGHRGDRIIVDDPHDVNSAESDAERFTARRWFSETLPTRLNKQAESAMVMIMQRLNVEDLSGLVVDDLGDTWTHLRLPMEFEEKNASWTCIPNATKPVRMLRTKQADDPIPVYTKSKDGELLYLQDERTMEGELLWEERFPREAVEDLKTAMASGDSGTYAIDGQLQQRPINREGGMFLRDNFQVAQYIPEGIRWVRGWDLAATKKSRAAWTAGVRVGMKAGILYIGDVVRFRGTSHEVEERIVNTAKADGYACAVSIPQDPGQAGKAQRNRYAQLLQGFECHFSGESGSKEIRAVPFAAQVEAQNVFVPMGAGWLSEFLAEAGLFPMSTYKDQIDAATRAYAWLLSHMDQDQGMVPSKGF